MKFILDSNSNIHSGSTTLAIKWQIDMETQIIDLPGTNAIIYFISRVPNNSLVDFWGTGGRWVSLNVRVHTILWVQN